jgi:hypothetical protein
LLSEIVLGSEIRRNKPGVSPEPPSDACARLTAHGGDHALVGFIEHFPIGRNHSIEEESL